MINEYRQRYSLPVIPLSASLCYVASLHVKDLSMNHPDNGDCNAHSWSDKGFWKPFCYPKDEIKQNSVWNKPSELTGYKGKGYEIIYWETENSNIDSIMSMWTSVTYFNNFLTNTGKWTGKNWNAIGIAIFDNYASAWFGEMPDPAGEPRICGRPLPVDTTKASLPDSVISLNTTVQEPVASPPAEIKKPDTAVITGEPVKPGVYYIITLSNQPGKVMQKALENAIKKGYTGARIINGDKLRLSVADFRQKAEADSALREIRKTIRDAWIFVK
jgi:hypothetical protein